MAREHNVGDKLDVAIRLITVDVKLRFEDEVLNLAEPRINRRRDGMSGKVRDIAIESIMQQVMEHVVVGCMKELWDKKICTHQYASIKGRGQVSGAQQIQSWVKAGHVTYFVKGDVSSCFGSIRHDVVMRFLKRDIGKNKKLLRCVEMLLKYHSDNGVGLLIGSLLSQFLCNYLLSYAYRYVENLHKVRRGHNIRLVTHVLFYMDDFLITARDRRNLMMAMRMVETYMANVLGLSVKIWHVKEHAKEAIDMMGYVIHGNGRIKVRHRIFRRARKAFFRMWSRPHTVKMSRRVSSYYGYLKYARVTLLRFRKGGDGVRTKPTLHLAANIISLEDRRQTLCAA